MEHCGQRKSPPDLAVIFPYSTFSFKHIAHILRQMIFAPLS